MERAIRVMHFADTHFGVELYGQLDPYTGINSRLLDFKKSLLNGIEMAISSNVDMAIFTGDAYRTRDPRQTDQREFAECIRELTRRGIPVVMLTGNHDMPAVRGRANSVEIYRTLGVENVYVISRPETILIPTAAGIVRVAGMPYLMKGISVSREEFLGRSIEQTKNMLEDLYHTYLHGLADEIRASEDNLPTILMGHFWVNGSKLSDFQNGYWNIQEPQVSLSDLIDPAFDYVALGHIHKYQDLNPGGQPHIVYCGSPDRIDFGEWNETKGFVMVELKKGGAEYQFLPIEVGRKMNDIRIDADNDEPTETILRELKRWKLENSIVRLTYTINEARRSLVREREIREVLKQAHRVVSITQKVERDASARSRLLTESRTPREALQLYIETQTQLLPIRERLLEAAELLFNKQQEEEESR